MACSKLNYAVQSMPKDTPDMQLIILHTTPTTTTIHSDLVFALYNKFKQHLNTIINHITASNQQRLPLLVAQLPCYIIKFIMQKVKSEVGCCCCSCSSRCCSPGKHFKLLAHPVHSLPAFY